MSLSDGRVTVLDGALLALLCMGRKTDVIFMMLHTLKILRCSCKLGMFYSG